MVPGELVLVEHVHVVAKDKVTTGSLFMFVPFGPKFGIFSVGCSSGVVAVSRGLPGKTHIAGATMLQRNKRPMAGLNSVNSF